MSESLVAIVETVHERLEAVRIPHAFGGALALAYGVATPRGTADIDINLFVPPARAGEVRSALGPAVSWSDADTERIARDGQVRVFWGRTPLDLFFSTTEFHEQAAEQVREVSFAGGTIPVLDPNDLAVCKAYFDRRKDWADLEAMAEVGSFEPDVVLRWLRRLLSEDDERIGRLRQLLAEVDLRQGDDWA